jgi:hypothetical protein
LLLGTADSAAIPGIAKCVAHGNRISTRVVVGRCKAAAVRIGIGSAGSRKYVRSLAAVCSKADGLAV